MTTEHDTMQQTEEQLAEWKKMNLENARKLSATVMETNERLIAERDALRAQLVEALKDTQRLDWCEENGTTRMIGGVHVNWQGDSLRMAIDRAMGRDKP